MPNTKHKIRKMLNTSAVALLTAMAVHVSIPAYAADLPKAAQTVVNSYFDALQSGDTRALAELASGRLKTKANVLRNNRDYARQLRKDNGSRTFEISEVVFKDGGMIQVEYGVSEGSEQNSELQKMRLTLTDYDGEYRVVANQASP